LFGIAEIEKHSTKNQLADFSPVISYAKLRSPMKEYQLGTNKEEVYQMLPERRIKKVLLGNQTIGLLRLGDRFFAFDSQCPHRGADLLQANINGSGEIICPLHQYRFDLKTGQVRSGYCGELPVYPIHFSEHGLLITMP
jgi:3-phenylpropionate/trans-cinnamate dioxygenase ferredoxin subunit